MIFLLKIVGNTSGSKADNASNNKYFTKCAMSWAYNETSVQTKELVFSIIFLKYHVTIYEDEEVILKLLSCLSSKNLLIIIRVLQHDCKQGFYVLK